MAEEDETPPNATVYVRNLDEKVKIPKLTEALRDLFSELGDVVEVVAKKNLKAKGQAFVVFDSAETAQSAIEELQGFDLFDKPLELAFAKSRSDATVLKENGVRALEEHKQRRTVEKERKQALEAAEPKPAKRAAPEVIAERPAKTSKPGVAGPGGTVGADYLPPHKIILIQELPVDYGKEQITAVFNRFPGLVDIRLAPGHRGIAFAEYEDVSGATAAKEAMNGVTIGEKVMRVTYNRK